ncbi:hypothetical protein D9M68_568630 [compost metagenome]
MTDVSVKTKAGFINQGVYAKRGSTIVVSEERAKELLRGGLIEDFAGEKAAPPPENKPAPKPRTKAPAKATSKE